VTFAVPGRYLTDIRLNQAKQPLKIEVHSKPGEAPGAQQLPPAEPDSSRPLGNAPPAAGPTLREGGVVTFIDNSVDTTTGTIKLKGTFENSDHGLWPGLFVQVTLVLSTDAKAVVVPAAAVQVSQTGQYVFVVKQDRTVEVRPVAIDRQQGEEMVIAKGLSPGEEVVTDGHLRLTAGARVTTDGRGQGSGERGRGNGAGGEDTGRGRRGNREGNQS
jgi:multidrug efflux pump subunit AcrA (membrane-fusion protein)